MIWTDEAVEDLKKMWDKGMTTGQIAKVLNVTKNSIIGKVHRLCLKARPSPIKRSTHSKSEKATDTKSKKVISQEEKIFSEVKEKSVKESKCKKETCPAKPSKEKKEIVAEPKVEAPKVVEEINIPLVKLDNHTCRWPIGDPRDEDFCFCGKKVKSGQTYCDEHSAIAYVKPGKKS